MPRVAAHGIQIHYITAGNGPNVVLVHGFLGNLAVWHLRLVPLLRQRYRVTTYDLRGHGYSELTRDGYSAREMAADLLGLLNSLNISKAALIGHSFGADIALYFALQCPERVDRIVGIEPGLAALAGERFRPEWPGWSSWVTRLEASGVAVPEEKRSDPAFLLDLSLSARELSSSRGFPLKRDSLRKLVNGTTLLNDYSQVDDLTLDALRTINTPVFLVYGDRSPFLPALGKIRERLPNCRSFLVPGAEHFGPLEMPDPLTESISTFLDAPGADLHNCGNSLAAAL